MSPAFKKNLITTALVIAGFILVSVIFNMPAFTGKILASSDYLNWKSVSQEAHLYKQKTGDDPLWSNSMFGGMPTNTFYGASGGNYVRLVHEALMGFLPRPANFMFLSMICFFALMSVMRINKWLGAVGAIAYTFATYNCLIMATGHETKMTDIAYMPAVLAGLILLMRGKYLGGAALMAISFAISIYVGHYQIVYYLLFILLAAGIGLLIAAFKKGQVKTALIGGVIALAVIGLGAGTNMSLVLPTLEYSKQTQRGGASELHSNHDASKKTGGLDKKYAFAWSNAVGETFCILVPYLYGGASYEEADRFPETSEAASGAAQLPGYWGPQSVLAGPVYFGAIVCFLFVLGMMLVRSQVKWWLLGVSIFGILLSVGDHFAAFNYAMFDMLPGLNKFRAPSTALVIPQLLFPLIGIWGINEVLRGKIDNVELWKKVKIAAIITGGLALIIGLGGGMFFDFTNSARDAQMFGERADLIGLIKSDRAAMARNSSLLSALFIVLTAGLLWMYTKGTIKAQYLIAGLGLLIAIDLMPIGHRYLKDKEESAGNPYKSKEEYDAFFEPDGADQAVLQDKDPYYRVLDMTGGVFSDSRPSLFHKSIGGYSAAKLENYQDVLDVHMSNGFNSEVMNLLNTKYFIVGQEGQPRQVIPNPSAYGNAWFVSNIKWAKTAEEEINALKAPSLGAPPDSTVTNQFNGRQTVVFRDRYQSKFQGFTPGVDSGAVIKLTKYGLNDLAFQSQSSKEGVAVFSDVYYDKGWTAKIDGKDAEILRANYFMRALRIPAGKHEIKFTFMPASYAKGKMFSIISSIILLALAAAAIVMFFKNRTKDEPVAA